MATIVTENDIIYIFQLQTLNNKVLNQAEVWYRNRLCLRHVTDSLPSVARGIYIYICTHTHTYIFPLAIYIYRIRQKYLTIWQHSCEWNFWRGEFVFERPSSETQSILFAMEGWSVEHLAFAVETYFQNNDSVVLTERIFRRHFNILRNDSVPSHNTLLLWARNLRETASAAKRKLPGREPSLRTPENIGRVRQGLSEVLGDQQTEMPMH